MGSGGQIGRTSALVAVFAAISFTRDSEINCIAALRDSRGGALVTVAISGAIIIDPRNRCNFQ